MKQHFILRQGRKRLLLFFAGWGMDETPFLNIRPTDKDWMICYDYRSPDFDTDALQGYEEILLVAWSMGVWAATRTMAAHPLLPVVRSTAVNGTPYPIDDEKGIATAIFEGTLRGLDETSLQKFHRRMCGSATAYREFQATAPRRGTDELKEELSAIQRQYTAMPTPDYAWQRAIIGENDRIFLPQNQRQAWNGKAGRIEHTASAHYERTLFEHIITQTD